MRRLPRKWKLGEPTEREMTIWAALLVLMLGLVALSHAVEASPPADRLADIEDDELFAVEYIRTFHESVCTRQARVEPCIEAIRSTKRWRRAPEIARALATASREHGVSIEELLVLARYESSFRPSVIGGVGEVGLFQVHGRAAREHDLSTLEGQARAGAGWYARCLERCDERIEALGAYQSGRCRILAGARLRERKIRELEAIR